MAELNWKLKGEFSLHACDNTINIATYTMTEKFIILLTLKSFQQMVVINLINSKFMNKFEYIDD